jgi:ABC-2 type transport system permease protein
MRRILAILKRDLLSTTRDPMLIYTILAPFLIALVARFVLPGMSQTALNLVITQESAFLAPALERYAHVEIVPDRARLERRVLAFDEAVGIVPDGQGGYTLVFEGNETRDAQMLPAVILQQVLDKSQAQVAMIEVGESSVPYREWIGALTAMACSFLTSFVMAFAIIEDRETRMMLALGVSPLSRKEYVAARSLLVVLPAAAVVFPALWAMGITGYDVAQLLLAVIVGSLLAILFGFIVGAISTNQISGIANVKFGMLVLFVPAILAMTLPVQYRPALYWTPAYWSWDLFRMVLVDGATWGSFIPSLLWCAVTSLIWIGGSYGWLKRKLDFARG